MTVCHYKSHGLQALTLPCLNGYVIRLQLNTFPSEAPWVGGGTSDTKS